jgi:hypothetical protein
LITVLGTFYLVFCEKAVPVDRTDRVQGGMNDEQTYTAYCCDIRNIQLSLVTNTGSKLEGPLAIPLFDLARTTTQYVNGMR